MPVCIDGVYFLLRPLLFYSDLAHIPPLLYNKRAFIKLSKEASRHWDATASFLWCWEANTCRNIRYGAIQKEYPFTTFQNFQIHALSFSTLLRTVRIQRQLGRERRTSRDFHYSLYIALVKRPLPGICSRGMCRVTYKKGGRSSPGMKRTTKNRCLFGRLLKMGQTPN